MDMLVSLLSSLGINNSVWLQMIVFFVAYAILSNLVFKPFMLAYEHREKKTQGQSQQNQASLQKAQELSEQFEQKARALNKQVQAIYEKVREEASEAQGKILAQAKSESENIIGTSKQKIATEMKQAKEEAQKELPAIVLAVTEKLVGREL